MTTLYIVLALLPPILATVSWLAVRGPQARARRRREQRIREFIERQGMNRIGYTEITFAVSKEFPGYWERRNGSEIILIRIK